jgi:hypothetical protein
MTLTTSYIARELLSALLEVFLFFDLKCLVGEDIFVKYKTINAVVLNGLVEQLAAHQYINKMIRTAFAVIARRNEYERVYPSHLELFFYHRAEVVYSGCVNSELTKRLFT